MLADALDRMSNVEPGLSHSNADPAAGLIIPPPTAEPSFRDSRTRKDTTAATILHPGPPGADPKHTQVVLSGQPIKEEFIDFAPEEKRLSAG